MEFTVMVYIGEEVERTVKAKGARHAAKKAMMQVADKLDGEAQVEAADVYEGDPRAGGIYMGEFDRRDAGLD